MCQVPMDTPKLNNKKQRYVSSLIHNSHDIYMSFLLMGSPTIGTISIVTNEHPAE